MIMQEGFGGSAPDDSLMLIDQDHLDVIRELNGMSVRDEVVEDIYEKFEKSVQGEDDKGKERR